MKYKKTHAYTLQSPEVVLNLWAYTDESGNVLRLAGRAYVMDGNDDDKLALLRDLAGTDFLSASWKQVPANFSLVDPNGEKMHSIAHASMLSEANIHASLFGPLMEQLAKSLPEQLRCVDGEYHQFTLDLPQEPLTVTTVVIESDDGRLTPMVSDR